MINANYRFGGKQTFKNYEDCEIDDCIFFLKDGEDESHHFVINITDEYGDEIKSRDEILAT